MTSNFIRIYKKISTKINILNIAGTHFFLENPDKNDYFNRKFESYIGMESSSSAAKARTVCKAKHKLGTKNSLALKKKQKNTYFMCILYYQKGFPYCTKNVGHIFRRNKLFVRQNFVTSKKLCHFCPTFLYPTRYAKKKSYVIIFENCHCTRIFKHATLTLLFL